MVISKFLDLHSRSIRGSQIRHIHESDGGYIIVGTLDGNGYEFANISQIYSALQQFHQTSHHFKKKDKLT